MPLKVEVQTNVNDKDLTLDDINEIIERLQSIYHEVRSKMYEKFLSMKHLRRELFFVGILGIFYLITQNSFFLYFMPLSVLFTMIVSIIEAEVITNKTRQVMAMQIEHYKELKSKLLRETTYK